jgi:hypothetical protein
MKKILSYASVFMLLSAPAMAQTWSSNAPKIGPVNQPEGILIQPYGASANHCPTGLWPVTVGGVISCGTPNTAENYSDRAPYRRGYGGYDCPVGVKGCK